MTAPARTSPVGQLLRVLILCRNFALNLAYYRAGRNRKFAPLLDYQQTKQAGFWRVVNANFIDICVLEWCKLFADRREKHHWSKTVSDQIKFKNELLADLGIDELAFEKEIRVMRHYRDKFLAHLDSEDIMKIPVLDVAKKATWFYYAYVIQHEGLSDDDLSGLPLKLDPGYSQCEAEAHTVYERNS